jgi:hypothetical protein
MLIRQVFVVCKNTVEENHLATLTSIGWLLCFLQLRGKFDDVQEIIGPVLKKIETLDNGHLDVLNALDSFLHALISQRKYELAEQLCQRVLAGKEKVLEEEQWVPISVCTPKFPTAQLQMGITSQRNIQI